MYKIIIIILLLFLIHLLLNKDKEKDLQKLKEIYSKEISTLEKEKQEKEKENEILKKNNDDLKKEALQNQEKVSFQQSVLKNLTKQNEEIKSHQYELAKTEVELWKKAQKNDIIQENITFKGQLDNQIRTFTVKRDELAKELYDVASELEEYQQKREAINQEILRNRALKEKTDFYRIILTPESLEDIKIIKGIREKLHKQEFLDKMLYDNYISKSVKEMCKRVLEGEDPSGIYKITNISTQEIYIGKSTSVATRWTNHIKSACGLAGVADSQFQRALKQYGIENWTFELLEKCPKDKLTEREKYYITFYDTINYGYNQRIG